MHRPTADGSNAEDSSALTTCNDCCRWRMELKCQHPGDSSSTWQMAQGHTLMGPTLLEGTPATMWGLREQRRGLGMMRGQGNLWSMAGHMAPTGSRNLAMAPVPPQPEVYGASWRPPLREKAIGFDERSGRGKLSAGCLALQLASIQL